MDPTTSVLGEPGITRIGLRAPLGAPDPLGRELVAQRRELMATFRSA